MENFEPTGNMKPVSLDMLKKHVTTAMDDVYDAYREGDYHYRPNPMYEPLLYHDPNGVSVMVPNELQRDLVNMYLEKTPKFKRLAMEVESGTVASEQTASERTVSERGETRKVKEHIQNQDKKSDFTWLIILVAVVAVILFFLNKKK